MANRATHARSSSSPPKMNTSFNSKDKDNPLPPKPKPKEHKRHHQSHHSVTNIPSRPLPTIIKPSLNNKQNSNKSKNNHKSDIPSNETHLRQDSSSNISTSHSNSTDPYSYARHLKKPLPQVPQNQEIELMVNSNNINYQLDIEPEISDSDDIISKTDEDLDESECICDIECVTGFICNRYMKARFLLLFCNVLLIFVCFMFGMGHMYDIQLNGGIYLDDNFIVDKSVLFSNDNRAFSDVIVYENKTYESWIWLVIFGVFLIWFIFCLVYFIWICWVDFYNFIYGIYDKYEDDRKGQKGKQIKNNNYCEMIYPYCLCCFTCIGKRKCCMKICRLYSNVLLEYNYICGLDVAVYVLALIVKNIIVISIEILALLQYNGVEIINIGHTNEHLLAENMQFIVTYTFVIAVHQIIIGVLWHFYICKHDKCNGRYFNLILYCLNYIFYVFYIINPMVLIYTQYNGLYSSLFSNHFSLIQYLGIIVPLIFLSFMTYFGSLYFIRKTHQSWRYKFNSKIHVAFNGYNDINNDYSNTGTVLTTVVSTASRTVLTTTVITNNDSTMSNMSNNDNSIENEEDRDDILTPKNTMITNNLDKLNNLDLDVFAKKRIMDTFNDECCCKIFCNGKLLLDNKLELLWLVDRKHSINKYDHIQTIIIDKHRKQQILRRLLIMIFGIICIGFGIFIIGYVFKHFMSAIDNCPSNYDFCQYKVYPFYGNQCECRILRIYDTEDMNIMAVNTLLTDFNMLEAIQIDLSKSDENLYGNLSKISLDSINSQHLRIIDFEGVFIDDIDDNIEDILANVQYLRLYNAVIQQIPNGMLKLYALQYIDVGYNDIEDVDWLCDSEWNSQLKYLILSNNPMNYTLECIYSLLTNANILHINLFGNNIDISSFPRDKQLYYNDKTVYYLQNNPICYRFENSPQKMKDYSNNLYSFLSDSNGCMNDYCNFVNMTDLNNLCVPNLWNNNVCDQQCNSSICFYDAYDCQY